MLNIRSLDSTIDPGTNGRKIGGPEIQAKNPSTRPQPAIMRSMTTGILWHLKSAR